MMHITLIMFLGLITGLLTSTKTYHANFGVDVAAGGSFNSITGIGSVTSNDINSVYGVLWMIFYAVLAVIFLKSIFNWFSEKNKPENSTEEIQKENEKSYGCGCLSFIFWIVVTTSTGQFYNTPEAIISMLIFTTIITLIVISIGNLFCSFINLFENKKNKARLSIHAIVVMVNIILLMFVSSIPPVRRTSRWTARQKACYSNIRVLQGAVEMYNMDNHELMKDLNIMNLVGYVKNPAAIRCPEYSNASYTNIGDLSDDGEVSCGKDPVGDKKECKEKECHGTLYDNKK